jgi:single-strand DNA-binding protein
MQINTCVMSGRAAADASIKTLEGGAVKATFILEQWEHFAASTGRKPKRHSIQVEAWGKVATVIATYVGKGKQLVVHGQIVSNSWKDANDQWQNRISLKAESIDLVGEKRLPGETDENF